MAFFGLFETKPLTDKKIEKISKLACNPFAQPDVRMREMHRLLYDGSPTAIRGALKRFGANANGSIADEEEKQWLEDTLVQVGEDVVKPLEEYIRRGSMLTYALRAYRRLQGDETSVGFFLSILEAHGPEGYREGEAKLQFIWQLGDFLEDDRVIPSLCPFLLDHSDDIRWAVMELLERADDKGALDGHMRKLACEGFTELVTSKEVGPRIQQRSAELLAAKEWQIPGDVKELAAFLSEEFFLDKKRYVRRRTKR
ncbi:hypothetical protein KAI87_11625 [Myxococcota bacterium]|nr:hypothetical protein [Myxococcota bacterium]